MYLDRRIRLSRETPGMKSKQTNKSANLVTTSANKSAGQIFSYPVKLTWEFTSDNPIRSVFPLWPIYGLPMLLLRWLWIGNGNDGEIPPIAVFFALRLLMLTLSFVLEDWAIYELVESPKHRKVAVMLVASSYVTWTYQTHTFSNSIETLAVAWSLVLIQRIVAAKVGNYGINVCLLNIKLTATETFFRIAMWNSCICCDLRNLQSHYLSCFSFHSWSSFVAPF